MKARGFTLFELMIVLAIIGILAAVIFPAAIGAKQGSSGYSIGINGTVEERCIAGYKFVVGNKGQPTQVLDQFGKGVPCGDQESVPGQFK